MWETLGDKTVRPLLRTIPVHQLPVKLYTVRTFALKSFPFERLY